MSLSLCPGILGPLLWSVFWEPGVPCHCAGAWLIPVATALKPIIESKNMERLARCIVDSLTKLVQYPHTQPDMDSAAWSGKAQSFLHIHPAGPYLRPDGTVSRADVWRLRHECHTEYEGDLFEYPPSYGWPPFGRMREEDVELELRPHFHCSHRWAYSHWSWLPANVIGVELPTTHTTASPYSPSCEPPITRSTNAADAGKPRQHRFPAKAVFEASKQATMSIFWWCCTEVEKGHGGTLVPRLGPSYAPLAVESGPSLKPEALERVEEWLQTRSLWDDPEAYNITANSDGED
ncbi:hypothetical protein DL546_006752 [Coniochaeta pulveracea]|uniref:Uncharacterized protein n=1 Tax=Coniochaeta pulveracea TaxID=177199 RepID=A0A420YEW5_9PEZI|nr:hypothetical protein DL546_006752 [Coniochaeta pulveracea]